MAVPKPSHASVVAAPTLRATYGVCWFEKLMQLWAVSDALQVPLPLYTLMFALAMLVGA